MEVQIVSLLFKSAFRKSPD